MSLTRAEVLKVFPELFDPDLDEERGPSKLDIRLERVTKALLTAGIMRDELDDIEDQYPEGSRAKVERLERALKALRAGGSKGSRQGRRGRPVTSDSTTARLPLASLPVAGEPVGYVPKKRVRTPRKAR